MNTQNCVNLDQLVLGAYRWLGRLLSVLIIGLSTVGTTGLGGAVFVAGALATAPAYAGKAICGAKGQNACETKTAKSLGRPPNMFNCPQGSFFDLGTENCWSCPSGYDRTAEPIDGDKACLKKENARKLRATNVAKAGCPGGSFWDPIDGGTCWKCPDGFKRSAAGIKESNACVKVIGFAREELHTATKVSGECPNGSFWDPIYSGTCWSCPAGSFRTASPVQNGDACISYGAMSPAKVVVANKCSGLENQATGAFWDPINGGTCWQCPSGYIRSAAPVNSNQACAADRIVWMPDPYYPPGIFGIDNMDGALADMIRSHPETVEETAREVAKIIGANPDEYVKTTWAQLENAPETNLVLRSLAATQILNILMMSDHRSQNDLIIGHSAAHQYSLLRRHIASEMRQYYDAYTAVCNQRAATMTAVLNYGCKAQDPSEMIMHLLGDGMGTKPGAFPGDGVGLSVVNGVATAVMMQQIMFNPSLSRTIFPFLRTAVKRAIQRMGGEIVQQAVTAVGSGSVAVGGAIASAGMEIAIIAGQQVGDITAQAASVAQAQRDAQKDMPLTELAAWVKTETGYNDVSQYLGLMLAGTQVKGQHLVYQAIKEHNHPTTTQGNQITNRTNVKIVDVSNYNKNTNTNNQTIVGQTAIARDVTNTNNQTIAGQTGIARNVTNTPPPGFEATQKGQFRIAISAGKNLCMGVKGNGNPAQGDTVELADCNSPNALPFSVLARNFMATKNNLCLDTQGHNDYTGAPMTLWKCTGSINSQKWELTPQGQIKSRAVVYLCTEVRGPMKAGSPVVIDACANNPMQIWKPEP